MRALGRGWLRRRMMALTLAVLVSVWPLLAQAWLINEHITLTAEGFRELEKVDGYSQRLAKLLPEMTDGLHLCGGDYKAGCPTRAVLPALAGDHSCFPEQLQGYLTDPGNSWVGDILRISTKLDQNLAAAGHNANERIELKRQSHIDLQVNDDDYVNRAVLDYAHFLEPREDSMLGDPGLTSYLHLALSPGRPANALATYVNYHVAAVALAAHSQRPGVDRALFLRRALLAEMFALHFLQDAFAAGHFVGHWGEDPVRIGTHDYYNRFGFETTLFGATDRAYVAHGDGFLSDAETRQIRRAIAQSLRHLVDAATDAAESGRLLRSFAGAHSMETYDTCKAGNVPPGLLPAIDSEPLREVLRHLPMPARRDPDVPRLRVEWGPFFGGVTGGVFQPSYSRQDEKVEPRGRLLAALRFGYGVADLVNDPLNAQAFIDVGVVGEPGPRGSHDLGLSFRLRAPGYVTMIEGGVSVGLSALAKARGWRCRFCYDLSTKSAGGGALGLWSSGQLTDTISGQLSLFRDLSVHWFPSTANDSRYRVDFLAPVFTGRWVLPITGAESWSQSTDLYADLGATATYAPPRKADFGIYLSVALAGRVFP